MGYTSIFRYKIISIVSDDIKKKINDELLELTGYGGENMDFNETEEMKWYEYVSDLENLTTKYKNIKIAMLVEGEEDDDFYYILFENGVSSEANKIMYSFTNHKNKKIVCEKSEILKFI